MPLANIDAVIFYKRDKITTDLICCDVEVAGRVSSFHEEAKGWEDLIAHLPALPGFRVDWYEAIASPAFAANETVACYRR